MPTIKTSLAEIAARPVNAAQRAQLVALAQRPDAEIDFTDQEEVTPEKIAAGQYVITGRGGARVGAGRKPTGKLTKQVRLSPATVAKVKRLQKQRGLPTFSAALEMAISRG